ncbi:MAG: CapA family protein [Shinella sp.]|nr:CapA family protein [Shinella sp.]
MPVDEAGLQGHLSKVRQAAAEGAFVIAYLHDHHWEPNWREVPTWIQSLACACVDAGARMFVSHGAPVLQPIEIYRGAPIFFGLGNFLFHLNEGEVVRSAPDVWKSVVATCRFDGSAKLQSIDLHPIVIGGERLEIDNYHERIVPVPAPKRLAIEMIADLAVRSQKYGVTISLEECRGRIVVANGREARPVPDPTAIGAYKLQEGRGSYPFQDLKGELLPLIGPQTMRPWTGTFGAADIILSPSLESGK